MSKENKKGFWTEFKEFISKGSVLDMAIGVIIGGAFNTIITALTNKILMPIVNAVLSYVSGGQGLYTILWASKKALSAEQFDALDEAGQTAAAAAYQLGPNGSYYSKLFYIDWSAFIEAVINFLIIALTLFIIIKIFRSLQAKRKAYEEAIKAKKEEKNKKDKPEEVVEDVVEEEAPQTPKTQEDDVVLLLKEIRDSLKKSEIQESKEETKE